VPPPPSPSVRPPRMSSRSTCASTRAAAPAPPPAPPAPPHGRHAPSSESGTRSRAWPGGARASAGAVPTRACRGRRRGRRAARPLFADHASHLARAGYAVPRPPRPAPVEIARDGLTGARALRPSRARGHSPGPHAARVRRGTAAGGGPPPSPPRTKWTRRVPHPVLTGHAAGGGPARRGRAPRRPRRPARRPARPLRRCSSRQAPRAAPARAGESTVG
jgi:hypothetical protein